MLREYLKTSPIAETVQLKGNVILHRQKISTDDLLEIEAEGDFIPGNSDYDNCELEVNELTVAKGKIVRKKGESYFKVHEMNKGAKE